MYFHARFCTKIKSFLEREQTRHLLSAIKELNAVDDVSCWDPGRPVGKHQFRLQYTHWSMTFFFFLE